MANTRYIVLSKRPYQESALLLSGLSTDYGKLDLVAHGAQKIGAKSMPVADLYRELEIEFEISPKSELGNLRSAELVSDFAALADRKNSFLFAGKVANFVLKNTAAQDALPFTYDVLRAVLSQLASKDEKAWPLLQCAVILKLTYLYENGLLPETEDAAQGDFFEQLIGAGIENSELPNYPESYYQALHDWLNKIIDYHQLSR